MPSSPTYRLRFFFDWGTSTCLWAVNDAARERFGYPVAFDALPLSPETVTEAERMAAWHDTALNGEYPPDPGPWREEECARFNVAVPALYARITTELGAEYAVVNEQREYHEDPELDAYLADPKGFRRNK